MPISLLVPELPSAEELLPYLKRIDAARWYTNFGPLASELEERMALLLSGDAPAAQKVVAVCNATLGLEVALLALRLSPGSRVLLPALTFVATATAVIRAGCVPVFCDVDPLNWLLTPVNAREAIASGEIDAVMPVATFGCACDAKGWDAFSDDAGIPVVIDAAGAFGNQTCGANVTVVFSLHATKAFAAAEGGLVVSTDVAYAARVRSLANFGITAGSATPATQGSTGLVHLVGTNAKLSEYHAALGLASLDRWPASVQKRIDLHHRYLEALGALDIDISLQARARNGVYSIMPVELPANAKAAGAYEYLRARGIETRRWYCPPLTDHPAFRSFPTVGALTTSAALGEQLLALPFHLKLGRSEIAEVCKAVQRYVCERDC